MTASELAERLRGLCDDPSCVTPSCLVIRAAADMIFAQGGIIAEQRAKIKRFRDKVTPPTEVVCLRAALAKAEDERDAVLHCPTCGEPWAFRLCARCTPPDDTAARLAQEVECLRAELAEAKAERNTDAATVAFNAIATATGCSTWEYPGQIVRDVEALVLERDNFRARIAAAEGPAWWCDKCDHVVAWVGSETGSHLLSAQAGEYRCVCCYRLPRRVLILDDPETKPAPPACDSAPKGAP